MSGRQDETQRIGKSKAPKAKSAKDGSRDGSGPRESAGPRDKSARKHRSADLGRALRSVYDDTLRETVPDDFLDLLGKLD